jgi:leucyl/phenylalanyl-tRNA--protein transferase
MAAYTNGIFPWPVEEGSILWFAPPVRAVLDFDKFKIPKSLPRYLKKCDFHFKINSSFESVIKACSHRKDTDNGTWITQKMIEAYIDFHHSGNACSFETFDSKGGLVGGLYGVMIGKYFSGESMFYRVGGASKFALIETVNYLKEHGVEWIDVQVMNSFTASFGATNISRKEFMERLEKVL